MSDSNGLSWMKFGLVSMTNWSFWEAYTGQMKARAKNERCCRCMVAVRLSDCARGGDGVGERGDVGKHAGRDIMSQVTL